MKKDFVFAESPCLQAPKDAASRLARLRSAPRRRVRRSGRQVR